MNNNIKVVKLISNKEYIYEKGGGKVFIKKIYDNNLNSKDDNNLNKDSYLSKDEYLKNKLKEYADSILLDDISDLQINKIIELKPKTIEEMDEIKNNFCMITINDILQIIKKTL